MFTSLVHHDSGMPKLFLKTDGIICSLTESGLLGFGGWLVCLFSQDKNIKFPKARQNCYFGKNLLTYSLSQLSIETSSQLHFLPGLSQSCMDSLGSLAKFTEGFAVHFLGCQVRSTLKLSIAGQGYNFKQCCRCPAVNTKAVLNSLRGTFVGIVYFPRGVHER